MGDGLYMFRHKRKLSQQAMADKIGCCRDTYAAVENGKSGGSKKFWLKLQLAFKITDEQLGGLMRNDT